MRTLAFALVMTAIVATGQQATTPSAPSSARGAAPTPVTLSALEAAFPDNLGTFKAVGGMRELSAPMVAARRNYQDGQRQLTVNIVDTSSNALGAALLTGFKEESKANENSSETVRRTVLVGKYPGVLAWRKATNSSQLEILIDDRFIVRLLSFPVSNADEVFNIAKSLKLSGAL